MIHGSSEVTRGIKAKGPPLRGTAMTYLSDKEHTRVNDVQEVPEAAIEGGLQEGWERRDQLQCPILQKLGGPPCNPPLLLGSHSPQTPHVGNECP